MTPEDFFGGKASTSSSRSPASFPRVSAAEQAERDDFSRNVIQVNEQRVERGEPAILPASPWAGGGTGASGAPAALSAEAFFGDAGGPASPSKSNLREQVGPAVDRTLLGLKRMGGEAAALADLVLSIPGFVLGTGAQLGGTVSAAARGIPFGHKNDPVAGKDFGRYTAYSAGREVGHEIAGPFMNPLQKVIEAVKGGEFYEGALTTQAMSKFGELLTEAGKWAEAKTGGRVSRDSVPMLVETLMASAPGLAGGKRNAFGIDPKMRDSLRQHAEKMRDEAVEEGKANVAMTPEVIEARMPVQQQINSLLNIKTAQERAGLRENQRVPTRAEELGGTVYDSAAEPQTPARIGQAEILRIMQKPGFERTADDLITLREARKEGGNVSKDALMLLNAAGIGAAVGGVLDDEKLRGAVLGGMTGIGAAAPFMGTRTNVLSRMREAGAVKEPGGMWHPEAVERLAEPLRIRMEPSAEIVAAHEKANPNTPMPHEQWAPKKMRDYLNRYAGTARDPLKDIEIPFGEGVKRWEEITDSAIRPREVEGPKGKETQWELPSAGKAVAEARGGRMTAQEVVAVTKSRQALESYLSHVGDFLRQNVDPAKLPQYDLVRAVKETAANDARVAKEMEKSAAAGMKDLPTIREYPDGMRWVELKERAGEAKGVEYTGNKTDMPEYTAMGVDGKPIRNSYTGEIAGGDTPQRAHLAGRLAEEGNQMGHCVGGYCEGVASGESRIFSLRDGKGKSHVTIEVEPILSPETTYARAFQGAPKENISQIKGKQNRAPNSEYLPYVQDFVRNPPEGKAWGEVGDLGNTGLIRGRDVGGHTAPGGTDIVNKLELGAKLEADKFYTPAELRDIANSIRADRGQRGSADPRLLMGLGAIGLGGLLGAIATDDPLDGLLMGAVAGGVLSIPGASRRFGKAVEGLDNVAGLISTRIRNYSEPLHRRLLDYEKNVLTESKAFLDRVTPWMKESVDLPASKRKALDAALLMNDPKAIAQAIQGSPALVTGWREVRSVLGELGGKAQQLGRFKELLSDYFPRRVKDFEGLKESLDQPIRTRLETSLREADARLEKSRGYKLTDPERDAIINRELRNAYSAQTYKPGYAKVRTVKDPSTIAQFYHTPQESLYITVGEVVKDIEMAKLFGKELVQSEQGGRKYINVDLSIGNLVGRELAEGKLTPDQVNEVASILRSRFGPGEVSPWKGLQDVRNLGYAGLLADLPSAAVQLGDPALALYRHGLQSTMTAIARRLSGNQKITAKDFGLANHVAEELAWGTSEAGSGKARAAAAAGGVVGAVTGAVLQDDLLGAIPGAAAGAFGGYATIAGTSAALHKVLKQGVFSPIDRFGKDVHLNAALDKAQRLSETPAGRVRLQEKYGKAFGNEMPQLISDLQAGRISEPVRSLLFSELSHMQPISKMEVPQAYLNNPNGRLLYQLKTFMLKQADIVRRDAYNEMAKKTLAGVARGLRNMTEFAMVLGISGAGAEVIKNWLLGRDEELEASDVLENVLKTFGWSKYVRDKAEKEPMKAILGTAVPAPVQMMDRILTRDPRAVQYIPVVGELYYNWELGGQEESEIRKRREDKKEGKTYDLSPRAQAYYERKLERNRERREAR